MERARDHVIKPRLAVMTGALTSRCSPQAVRNAHGALVLALGLMRQEQLLGLPDSFDTAALMGPILKGTANCMLQQCSRYGPRLAQSLFATARQVELLGASASDAFFSALLDNLVACSKGEVHLDSTITRRRRRRRITPVTTPCGSSAARPSRPRPTAGLDLPGGPAGVPGRAREQVLEWELWTGADCFYHDTLRVNSNGAFRINQLNFSPLDPAKPDTSPPIEKLSLTITQDPTEYEDFSVSGAGCGDAVLVRV